MFAWRWLLTVSCVGQPLCADTSQMLLRPLMLLRKAICLPSGDQVLSPTLCDMNSFSMLSGCTSNFSLETICAGSVMTLGDGAGICEKAWEATSNASMAKMRICFICAAPPGLVSIAISPQPYGFAYARLRLGYHY